MRKKQGKGKIHPSPSQQAPVPPGNSCLSALSLLPAAILALTAVLCIEDKEVLAYFITRSFVIGSVEASGVVAGAEQSRRKGGGKGTAAISLVPHPPRFDCSCFECYTSFWIRWGSSPHGELIHQAIEAFEKKLAEGEGAAGRRGSGVEEKKDGKGGRKGKKKKATQKEKEEGGVVGIAEKDASGVVGVAAAAENGSVADPAVVVQPELALDSAAGVDERSVVQVPGEWPEDGGCKFTGTDEKKKPWVDVMGFLNSRLWSLWSPTA